MIGGKEDRFENAEISWAKYPSDEDINRLGCESIHIGNYDVGI